MGLSDLRIGVMQGLGLQSFNLGLFEVFGFGVAGD